MGEADFGGEGRICSAGWGMLNLSCLLDIEVSIK